ncbi:MAG: hypothetical protein JNM09_11280 [Blastocatellia bacterium]|nr:hypothetical protein [Blastocatellia bacterium]
MSEEFFDYEHQEPKNPLIAFLLIVSCIFVVAVCAFLSWMFIVARDNEHNRKIDQATYTDLQNLRKAEDAKLHGYQYLNKDQGTVRIPIERAMQLIVEETKNAPAKVESTPTAAPAPTTTPGVTKPMASVPPPPPVKAAAAGQKK